MIANAEGKDAQARLAEAEEELQKLRAEVESLRKLAGPDLTKLQKDIKKKWFRFITDKVNPGYQERHHGNLRSWGPAMFKEAGELGLPGLGLPKELGGDGLDPVSAGIVLEELAKMSEDPGFLVMMAINKKVAKVLAKLGRADLTEQYVQPILKGELVTGWATWEPGDPSAPPKTVAKKTDEGYVLSGLKPFVTSGAFAKAILVSALYDATKENAVFMIRTDDPGVKQTALQTVGGRHLGFTSLALENVKLPKERLVLDQQADLIMTAAYDEEVLNMCAIHLGWMQHMFNLAIETLRPKVRDGIGFLEIPHVQGQIGRLHIGIEVARGLFLRVLEQYRLGKTDPESEPLTLALKYYVTDRTIDTAQTLMQLQGGQAYLDDSPWGRYLTHVACLLHAGGQQDLMPRMLGYRFLAELELRKLRKFTM